MMYIVFNPQTGDILRTVTCSAAQAVAQLSHGEDALLVEDVPPLVDLFYRVEGQRLVKIEGRAEGLVALAEQAAADQSKHRKRLKTGLLQQTITPRQLLEELIDRGYFD